MNKELKKVKIILGRFMPFHLGHLKIATYTDLNGPDREQANNLRETPNLKEISKLPTVILSILTPKEKVDSRHPFDSELMKEEMEMIKSNYKEIEDILYVKSADICAWGELLKENGYQAAVWITGSDEFNFYKGMAIKVPEYEEKNRDNRDCKGAYTKSFYVEEVKRNETSTDDFISTISGTKVRESLKNDDRELFKKMMPTGVYVLFDKFKEALSNAPEPKVKKSRKIKEYLNNIKPINTYIIENLRINKNIKVSSNGYEPKQGEHDKSQVYDDIWNDIKDSLYKWNAGPVYGFKGDKGVSFQVRVEGKYKGYWIVIKYNNSVWNDSFLITLAKYATDYKSESEAWKDGVYAGDESRVIDNFLGIK